MDVFRAVMYRCNIVLLNCGFEEKRWPSKTVWVFFSITESIFRIISCFPTQPLCYSPSKLCIPLSKGASFRNKMNKTSTVTRRHQRQHPIWHAIGWYFWKACIPKVWEARNAMVKKPVRRRAQFIHTDSKDKFWVKAAFKIRHQNLSLRLKTLMN